MKLFVINVLSSSCQYY